MKATVSVVVWLNVDAFEMANFFDFESFDGRMAIRTGLIASSLSGVN
jgi:hypothetical protein